MTWVLFQQILCFLLNCININFKNFLLKFNYNKYMQLNQLPCNSHAYTHMVNLQNATYGILCFIISITDQNPARNVVIKWQISVPIGCTLLYQMRRLVTMLPHYNLDWTMLIYSLDSKKLNLRKKKKNL